MKNTRKSLLVLSLASLGIAGLAACSNGPSGPATEPSVFENASFYYEVLSSDSEEGKNLSVRLDKEGEISAVTQGRVTAEAGEYSYTDGVLTLSHSFLKKINAGEKTISVTIGGKKVSVYGYFVDKVITTAQEFQDINKGLDKYYILGNDIDLSSIANFEPLGSMGEETDPTNEYFHGILEGNGYTVKNASVLYSDSVATNYNVYMGTGTHFTDDHHKSGDNVGLFQTIGSSGVVRNVTFDNIHVRGRTIVGALAANVQGLVENCRLTSTCQVEMSTHFYDDDCNMGGAFGIVAGSGQVKNVISEVSNLTLGSPSSTSVNYNGNAIDVAAGVYLDFGEDYPGKTGNGWDHSSAEGNTDPWWRFAAANKDMYDNSGATKDSNGQNTNGVYSFVGKCWGSVENSVGKAFKVNPMNGAVRDVCFGQTHVGTNKPTSGSDDLGTIEGCDVYSDEDLKKASTYAAFDEDVWNIVDGSVPTIKPQYQITVAASDDAE